MDNKYISSLYEELKGKYELGSYEEFSNLLTSDEKYRKSIFEDASAELELGTYDEFTGNVQVKKKDLSEIVGIPSDISAEVSSTEQPPLTSEQPPAPETKPKAKTFSDYVGAFTGTIDEGLAGIIDGIDYLGTLTQDAIYQVAFGKESASEVSKMRKEGTLSPALNPQRLTETISQAIRYAGRHKELPKDTKTQRITSGIIEGTASVVPDIIATFVVPEIKLPSLFQRIGLKQLSKFGTVIGTEQAVESMQTAESGTATQKIATPLLSGLEGFATGMTFDALGGISSKIGSKIANKIIPETKTVTKALDKALLQHSTTSLTNATFFGGYGNLEEYLTTGEISGETFATNAGMGLALGIRETGKLLYAKGIHSLLATPREVLNKTIKSEITSEELAKQAQEKIDNVESGQSTDREGDAISAKILANASILKATVDEIKENPDEIKKSITESELDPKLQEAIIDKVDEIVADNDPKVQEAKKYTDDIALIDDALDKIRKNKSWSDGRKEAESRPLKIKKEELRKKELEVYGIKEPEPKEGEGEKKKEPTLTKEDKAKIDDVLKKEELQDEPIKEAMPTKAESELSIESVTERAIKYGIIDRDRGTDVLDLIGNYDEWAKGDANFKAVVDKIPKQEWEQLKLDARSLRGNEPRVVAEPTKEEAIAEEPAKVEEVPTEVKEEVPQELSPTKQVEEKQGEVVQEKQMSTELEQEKKVNIVLNKERSNKKEEGFSYDVYWYDITDKQGDVLGNVILLDRGDYYQVQNAKVNEPRKGVGLEAYKQLISELDKPLYSDTALTQPAHGLWNKLVKEGLAEQFKENIGSEKKPNIISRYRTISKPQEPQGVPVEPLSTTEGITTPPKVESVAEATPEGKGKVRTIGRRAIESANLPQDVKDELIEKGIEYIPRGRKFTDPEAEAIVNLYEGVEGGLDKLAAEVYNTANDIAPDTRVYLNSIVAEKYNKLLDEATDVKERSIIRDKLTDSVIWAAEQGTLAGQWVEANKRWGKVLGTTPELIAASLREKLDRGNREFFSDKKAEVDFVKAAIEEYVKSNDFRKRVEEEVSEEISKIGTKNWGTESKKKIDDFFNGLLIDPKQQNLYGGLIGIPVAMYNGSILAIKNALLLGVDIATAIQRGVDYLDKEYKDKYEKGMVDSPEWNKKDYVNDTQERLKGLTIKPPKAEKPKVEKAKKPRKAKEPPTQKELVDKIFEKMAKFATRKQVSDFVMKYLQELSEKGAITDPRFRAILSQALGRSYVTEQTEAKLTNAARALGHANTKTEEFIKAFDSYIHEYEKDPSSPKLTDIKNEITRAKKEARKAQFNAQKANQRIREILEEEPDLVARMGTLIQGGLLIPSSQIANVLGNLTLVPINSTAYLVSGGADAIISKGLSLLEPLRKVDPRKHPWLYHQMQSMPTAERTTLPFAYAKGYLKGSFRGVGEGIKQLRTGALSRDLSKADIQRGIHPIEAAKHIYNTLSGKEKRKFAQFVGDVFEALPSGWMAEGHFRLLNIGDKPFRGGAETGRLEEIFEISWRKKIKDAQDITDPVEKKKRLDYLNDPDVKDVEMGKFEENPDTESFKEARKQGDIATFSQSSRLSRWISTLERKTMGSSDKTMSTISDTLLRLLKFTNVPYVKVPINLTVTSVELACPLIPMGKMIYHGYNGNKRAMMDDIGKMVISSIVTGVAMTLASQGLITTLSDDKDERAAQLAIGKEEGRINIDGLRRFLKKESPEWQEGDRSWSVKRLGIVSVWLMSIAQAYKGKTPEEIAKMREDNKLKQLLDTNLGMASYVPAIALQQSIMTGVNTFTQALLGGEAEKDRWLTSQAQVLSTLLYPNTLAVISQAADPEHIMRETRDLSKEEGRIKQHILNTFKDRMFMGKNLPAKVTIWGESVKRIPEGEKWSYHLLGITKEKKYQKYSFGTRLYEFYEQFSKEDPDEAKKIFPTLPTAATKVGWDDARMTPEELETYQMKVGTIRAEDAEAYVNSQEWEDATLDEKMSILTNIYLRARRTAESEMFSWINYKNISPDTEKNWDVLMENDALPLPSMTRKLGDYKLTPQEIEQLNNIALGYYAEEVVPYLTNNSKEALDADKEYKDEKTGKSAFVTELNKGWSKALKYARQDMEDILDADTERDKAKK